MKRLMSLLVLSLAVGACSTGEGAADGGPEAESSAAAATTSDELSAFEREHGIGPVTAPLELGALDAALAERGEELFQLKCMACHRLDERYIGPPLGDVLDRHTPAYVMNMMLNPTEMVERHPYAEALLAEYLAPMPFQDLSEADARALLEYLRTAAQPGSTTDQ